MKYGLNVTGFISNGGEMYDAILMIFDTLPLPAVALILLVITMIAFSIVLHLMASHMSLHLTVTNRLLPMKNLHARFVDLGAFAHFLPIGLLFAENSPL